MPATISALGCQGPRSKWSDGYFRFVCPNCGEMRATVNPRNNLSHCFSCTKNINNIDLMIHAGYEFRRAVLILETWLDQYEARHGKKPAPVNSNQ